MPDIEKDHNIHPPSLVELGLEDFNNLSGEKNICQRDSRDGINYVVSPLLAMPRPNKDEYMKDCLSLGLWTEKRGGLMPIGHVDFTLDAGSLLAHCQLAHLQQADKDYPYPEKFKDLLRAYRQEGIGPALWIQKDYRRKKLGALLWALGLGTLELMGYKVCRVRDDYTAEHWKAKSGFYERYGAKQSYYYRYITGKPTKAKQLLTLTHLTAEQEALILRFCNH